MPRRYRGRDLIWWLHTLGLDQTPRHKRGPDKALALITGAYGGHTIDFRELATLGVTLLGRVRGIRAGVAEILPDVAQSLETGDAAFTAFLDLVDAHVAGTGLDHPEECEARRRLPDPPCVVTPAQRLDLVAEGVNAVIWATGYRCDFRWIDMPIFDTGGQPLHRDGITKVPGLYFLGLPWLSKMNSSFLAGVGDDAARLADHIAAHRPCAPDYLATATAGHVPF
jgi:putative flavoprotein involved in K+ transport